MSFARIAGVLLIATAAASAGDASSKSSDPTFGSRTENRDGSVAMTIGRNLPTDWDSKVGTDFKLANPTVTTLSETLLRGVPAERSTGAIWGSISVPGLAPYVGGKTSLEARLDAADDRHKLGATLGRSVAVASGVSIAISNSYSIAQPLDDPAAHANTAAAGADASVWTTDQSVRLNIASSGTALSVSRGTSSVDEHWHSKLSVEQTVFGPLKVTTSVDNAGSPAGAKSVTAGFKRVW